MGSIEGITMSVTPLVTDYMIVGAGAMGMSFLEELITSSKDVEAIIIDTRAAPGGHWNDAYSFVRLHQPALTYGVCSRPLGDGGADLASKALILEHYELAMKDLLSTGRVKFFPQCKYLGDGKFVSLLDENNVYEVKINAKLVDATCTTTHVPATKKPNYQVSEGVHLVPINGLGNLSSPWPQYLIIGGGKTGIDAVLFLLDHGMDPEKISWIIPNDAWFWERDTFKNDDGTFNPGLMELMDPVIDERNKTTADILLALEETGAMMRLDKNIMPTRYRAATVNKAEIKKLQMVKNIIRKGRIGRIDPGKLIFQSGEEMMIDPETLCVDCSVNSTLFAPPKKVFDGNKINAQYIRLPPPGLSASAIAALELRFPKDEKKKNSVCIPLDVPQNPEDFIKNFYTDAKVMDAMMATLGFRWERQRRISALHHIKIFDLVKMMFGMMKRKERYMKKLERLMETN